MNSVIERIFIETTVAAFNRHALRLCREAEALRSSDAGGAQLKMRSALTLQGCADDVASLLHELSEPLSGSSRLCLASESAAVSAPLVSLPLIS